MTEPARFLIAKYVPDVVRNEPRNIGVVLWSPHGIVARFIGEKPDAPGEVDEAQIPPFVASPEAYKQWVRHWRREMSKEAIRPAAGGPAVVRTAPEFLEVLRQAGPSNYQLTDGGVIAELMPAQELPQVLAELFSSRVAPADVGALRAGRGRIRTALPRA